jgi:hypothetical protein
VLRRRGLLERNNYVITRFHHRYDEKGLPEDIVVRPAEGVQGGVGLPVGPNAEMPTSVEPAAENRLQIRYAASYASKKVPECAAPTRWRWGKAPPDYRGLRKTWTARDMAYRKRDRFALADVVKSSVPALGLASTAAAESAPAAEKPKQESGCALSRPGPLGDRGPLTAVLVAVGSVWVRRRQTARRG